MKYVFGPVPSRRLGASLGIDPIPLKTCNWNCVYCQLGRSAPITNLRREYYPVGDIVAEIDQALAAAAPGEIDWITFVGSGEPTLHSGLGEMIAQVKSLSNIPVAVITNGALLYLFEVREALTLAEAVLPSLDAGDPQLYRKINRPWPELSYNSLVDGLRKFRQEYSGQLWEEVMLIAGLNDGEAALLKIAAVLETISPDQVHLNTPVRPPAEAWVRPCGEQGIQRALTILGDRARLIHPPSPAGGPALHLHRVKDLAQTILALITRHPMREEDLLAIVEPETGQTISEALAYLHERGDAQVVVRYGKEFWSASGAHYAKKAS